MYINICMRKNHFCIVVNWHFSFYIFLHTIMLVDFIWHAPWLGVWRTNYLAKVVDTSNDTPQIKSESLNIKHNGIDISSIEDNIFM